MATGQEIASGEEIVRRVGDMYRRYPFPPMQRKLTYRRHVEYVQRVFRDIGFDPSGKLFGDFACGTGLMMLDYAQALPATTFIGYDISPASVERANAMLDQEHVSNARCEIQDIMHMQDRQRFDYILSWGTIHHLPDAAEGVRILCRALKPGGILRTGIYGFYGNWERRIQQAIIRSLTRDRDPDDFAAKIQVVREWAAGDRNFKNYHTAPPVDLGDDDWVVDEFLHVWEHHLQLADVVSWLLEQGMEVIRLTDYYDHEISLSVADHSVSEQFVKRAQSLPLVDQCQLIDMIVRPYWISLLARKPAA